MSNRDQTKPKPRFGRRVAPVVAAKRREAVAATLAADTERLKKEIEAAEDLRSQHRWWFFSLVFGVMARVVEIVLTGVFGRRSRKQVVTATAWNQAMRSKRTAGQAKKESNEKTAELEKLSQRAADELKQLDAGLSPAAVTLTKTDVAPRKSDVDVDEVLLVWLPWRTASDSSIKPAYGIPGAKS